MRSTVAPAEPLREASARGRQRDAAAYPARSPQPVGWAPAAAAEHPKEVVDPAEKMVASEALLEHVCRGRWPDAREASANVRTAGPKDSEPTWTSARGPSTCRGRPARGAPCPTIGGTGADGSPAYATAYTRPGWTD